MAYSQDLAQGGCLEDPAAGGSLATGGCLEEDPAAAGDRLQGQAPGGCLGQPAPEAK